MQIDLGRAGSALLRAAGPIAVAVAVQSAGNLAFHALVGRLLDPAAYGALGTVLAAMVMLGIPLGALQTAASAHAATHGAGRDTTRRSLRSVALYGLLPGVATLACAPLISAYFHLDGLSEATQLAPYLIVAAVLATARGLLLGTGQISAVASTYLVATGVRLVLGLGLAVPFGVAGALAATLLGEVAALAAAVRVLWRDPDRTPGVRLRLSAVGSAAVAVTGLFLFSTVDLLLARHHLAGTASGSYVAAATVAKTALALPAGIMAAVFPRLVAAYLRPGRGRLLLSVLAAVAGPALLGAAVLAAAPALVLRILWGDGYAGDTTLVQILATVAGITSVVTVLTNAALARRSWTTLIPWAGAVLEVVLIQRWHSSAAQIAACSAAALLPTLLVVAVTEGRAWTRRVPRALPEETALTVAALR
ncbi:polysaccharide biosynthesis protein [Actinoplanes awajinensis]|uniref:Polysaccharide biosynthesis protein n=1 Tax=Actinoplanes awajinensis subsp. mycoplanecinus TaxID=135947 RepID=A0A101JJR7_9ACTN|nr:polysaccharide biosynthesis protein [Actinoplanes awajinensis]KUL27696.1 polysaccharide biosynthesis protein [Actinoplanes awajinensis subsp. mycoplanecinus]